jgi:hypothetical protein
MSTKKGEGLLDGLMGGEKGCLERLCEGLNGKRGSIPHILHLIFRWGDENDGVRRMWAKYQGQLFRMTAGEVEEIAVGAVGVVGVP